MIKRDKKNRKQKDGDLLEGEEEKDDGDDGSEELLCVICMNNIHLEVDESGCIV